MKRNYYQSAGMTYVAIRVPHVLKEQLAVRVKQSGEPFRYVCQDMISTFATRVENARRAKGLDQITFVATYKDPSGPRIMLWIEPRLSKLLAALADEAHVSRRAFCYTAIQHAFESDCRTKRK